MQDSLKELKQRIQYQIPYLTKSQKIIANYIVEHPHEFALSSVRELEKELKTSKATIIRLAQRLGYQGYQELKSIFRESIRQEMSPIHRFKSILSDGDDVSNLLHIIAGETINNIETSLQLLDFEQYEKAIQLIEQKNQIYTMGVGISSFLAEMASYLLNRVSVKSSFIIPGPIRIAEQLINLSKNDLIIAFSLPPYREETIQAVSYAKEKGMHVIAVTDKATNQIVQYADILLQVSVDSSTVSNSIMAMLVVFYALSGQIGMDQKNKTLKRIESLEHVRKEHLGKK